MSGLIAVIADSDLSYPRGLIQIPARPRVRDTRATESVSEFPMILIIPNLGPCTYLPSPKTLYENPGYAGPQSRR